jgi:hypothetical protein
MRNLIILPFTCCYYDDKIQDYEMDRVSYRGKESSQNLVGGHDGKGPLERPGRKQYDSFKRVLKTSLLSVYILPE